MRNETYEVLLKCYGDAREGVAVVSAGVIVYINRALAEMAGEDICQRPLRDILPEKIADKIKEADFGNSSKYIERVNVFGNTVDIRVVKIGSETLLVFNDLDTAMRELKKNEESFKIIKNAHKKMVDSITAADSATELMIRCMGDDVPDPAITWLKMINDCMENMSNALMDIVEVTDNREENADKGCRLEDLSAYMHRIAEEMGRKFEIKGARLEISGEPDKIVFPVNIKSVINIFLRLLDYMADCARSGDVVRLGMKKNERYVEFTLCDCAGNIPEEYIEFLKNPQIDSMENMLEKYGNNLYLARRIVNYYDGSMDIENIKEGKKITVKLPRKQISAHVQQSMSQTEWRKSLFWRGRI